MTFTPEQKALLAGPLNKANVKPPAPGKYGEYIEGWKTIEEANRIFGFDGWTRETVMLDEANRDLVELRGRDGDPYKQWRIGYVAKVRVTAGGVVREGTGFGHGQGKPEALGDAIESAIKEAETDAMKRALMTFGNPFGLALYDKTKANVAEIVDLITDDQRDILATLAEQAGVTLKVICEREGIQSLTEMRADRFEFVRGKLAQALQQKNQKEAA